ncbi:hypothetical protein HK405_000886, partial [Cladochytrium tenue]
MLFAIAARRAVSEALRLYLETSGYLSSGDGPSSSSGSSGGGFAARFLFGSGGGRGRRERRPSATARRHPSDSSLGGLSPPRGLPTADQTLLAPLPQHRSDYTAAITTSPLRPLPPSPLTSPTNSVASHPQHWASPKAPPQPVPARRSPSHSSLAHLLPSGPPSLDGTPPPPPPPPKQYKYPPLAAAHKYPLLIASHAPSQAAEPAIAAPPPPLLRSPPPAKNMRPTAAAGVVYIPSPAEYYTPAPPATSAAGARGRTDSGSAAAGASASVSVRAVRATLSGSAAALTFMVLVAAAFLVFEVPYTVVVVLLGDQPAGYFVNLLLGW